MKKVLKWFLVICLIPIGLVLIISILLYIPPIQQFAVDKVTQIASEKSGMDIRVEKVRLRFPVDLAVSGIHATSPADSATASLGRILVSLKPLPLLKKKIEISTLEFKELTLQSGKLIEGIAIDGKIGLFRASPNEILLDTETAFLKQLVLDQADIFIRIDSIASDTTDTTASEPVLWKILADQINFSQVSIGLTMPADSLSMSVHLKESALQKLSVDLGKELYTLSSLIINDSKAGVDLNLDAPALSGIDPAHLALFNINIDIDSIHYCGREMHAHIRNLSAKERSGLEIETTGSLRSDSSLLIVPQLSLRTPYSKAELSAHFPWSSIEEDPQDNLRLAFRASMGKKDIQILGGEAVKDFMTDYPDRPISLVADIEGNTKQLYISKIKAALPGVFSLDMNGKARNLLDEKKRAGKITLDANTDQLDFLLASLPVETRETLRMPSGIHLKGDFSLQNGTYMAEALLSEEGTYIDLNGRFNPFTQAYAADFNIKGLEPIRYMPADSIMLIEGFAKAEGKGFDVFKSSTAANLTAALSKVQYKELTLENIQLQGALDNHRVNLTLNSDDPRLAINGSIDGSIKKDSLEAMIILGADSIDLYGLNLTEKPFSTSFQIFSEVESNLKKNHKVDITLGNWELLMSERRVSPKTLTLYAMTQEDTTRVSFHTGDFNILANANSDPATLGKQISAITDSLMLQIKGDSILDLLKIRPLLPELSLTIKADKDNPIYMAAQYFNVFFDRFRLDATTSPESGLVLLSSLHGLIVDTLKVDTISFDIYQSDESLDYIAQVKKNRFRNQLPFYVSAQGQIKENYIDIAGLYKDNRQDTVVYIGASARKTKEGIRATIFPENPTLAYIPFKVNKDNFFLYKDKKNMHADLRMEGDQLAALWLHSVEIEDKMNALLLEVNRINLDSLTSAIPSAPALSGYINSSFRYEPIDSMIMVAADMFIDSLVFDNGLIGNLVMQGVYMPLEDNNHQLDMHLMKDDREISSLFVHYTAGKQDKIEGFLNIDHLPLMMFNPMIPGGMGKMRGSLHGDIDISGTSDEPKVNGSMHLDTAGVYIPSVGTEIRFEEKPILVDNNLIKINRYKLYTHGDNPFVIDGSINARNLSKPTANLKLMADRMTLMNAPKTSESMLYGRVAVDLNTTIKGPLDALSLRGYLHVLGNTNVTYIMTESPLTSKDRMSGLVTFTYFNDTIPQSTNRRMRFRKAFSGVEASGMDMLLNIVIDPVAKTKVELNEDGSNYIDLNGGGDLAFLYNSMGEMQLNGRYTLNSGKIKYDLPILANKELSIATGSYIEFTGDPMDPFLNIKATERIRAAVPNDNGSTRLVNFDAGVSIKQTMNNLKLAFTLDAEDMEVKNQLASMGEEERGRQAITMLLTGAYLYGGAGGKGLDMNAALSSFLNNEINNIAGSALKGVDISVGMDTYSRDGMSEQTDFSFRFSKRFFNDRVNIILGGRIATGEGAETDQTFIDDATIEYRLDDGGTRYVKIFHNKNYENILEGEVMQTGAGIVFRKRMQKINELFFSRKKREKIREEEAEAVEKKEEVTNEEKKDEEQQ